MNEAFRNRVTRIGDKGLKILEGFLDGKGVDPLKVKVATAMAGQALKVEHMTQIREQAAVSHTLRLASLVKDPLQRLEYVTAMQPKLRPLLGGGPKRRRRK